MRGKLNCQMGPSRIRVELDSQEGVREQVYFKGGGGELYLTAGERE
jgi:hypothetical protein